MVYEAIRHAPNDDGRALSTNDDSEDDDRFTEKKSKYSFVLFVAKINLLFLCD